MKFIHQVEPYVTEREAEASAEYLRSGGWLTEFEETKKFAAMIADFTGAAHCDVVTSGTAALYLSLLALGIGPGDSVIVPDFTMIATPNAVKWAGADVILCDVERETLCLDLDKVVLQPNTKALMYVSINGRAGDLSRVVNFCVKHGLYLIEDACQAFGSRSAGRCLGTFGDIGCFSFTPHKIITTGQGGALVTQRPDFHDKIQKLKDFQRVAPGVDRHIGVGFNFKFTDMQAVVGIEQLKLIDFRMRRRREIYAAYQDRLAGVDWLRLSPLNAAETVPWFVDAQLQGVSRDAVIAMLKEHGIGSRPFYPPIHTQTPYSDARGDFRISNEIAAAGLWLPSSISLTEGEIDHVCGTLRKFGPQCIKRAA